MSVSLLPSVFETNAVPTIHNPVDGISQNNTTYSWGTFERAKMISYRFNNRRHIHQSMYRNNWRSNKFPDGSLKLKGQSDLQSPLIISPEPHQLTTYIKPKASRNETSYVPGRRCGIIVVNIQKVDNREVVSFVVVLGKPTMDTKGRPINIWSFGKGRMDAAETQAECASREFWEETGIKLDVKDVDALPRISIGKNVYFVLHTSKESMSKFSPKDTDEVQAVEWKTMDDLKDVVLQSNISSSYLYAANKDIRQVIRYPDRVLPFHRFIFRGR